MCSLEGIYRDFVLSDAMKYAICLDSQKGDLQKRLSIYSLLRPFTNTEYYRKD